MEPDTTKADWRLFREIVPGLRERYLAEKNKTFVQSLTKHDKTPTEQFWDTLKSMNDEAETLSDCLDNYKPSNLMDHMKFMCRCGMLRRPDLDGFSEPVKSYLQRYIR